MSYVTTLPLRIPSRKHHWLSHFLALCLATQQLYQLEHKRKHGAYVSPIQQRHHSVGTRRTWPSTRHQRPFARHFVRHDNSFLLVIIDCRKTRFESVFSHFSDHLPETRSFLTIGCDVTGWNGRPAVFAASVPKDLE